LFYKSLIKRVNKWKNVKPDNERVLNKSLVTEKFYLERIVNNRKITALKKKKKAGMDNKKK